MITHCLFICVLQIFIWFVIPAVTTAAHANHSISLIIIIQYIPRMFVIFPLNQRITKTTGVIAKTAWAGAAYYIMLYMLASHVSKLCCIVFSHNVLVTLLQYNKRTWITLDGWITGQNVFFSMGRVWLPQNK